MGASFGVYVHFPWCTVRCPYCDFAVSTERPIPQDRYTRAVLAELHARAPAFEGGVARTLYLGGGTPSLWEPERVAEVIEGVRSRLRLAPGAEVTLEANPESCDSTRLAAFREAGVNRVSIGVQSFDAAVLAKLGRRHGPEAAERAIRSAAAELPNVAVDLIYGARRSSVASARADAERLASLPIAHVSAYALTLDAEILAEEVPLARMRRQGRLPLPAEEDVLAQGRAIGTVLRRAGLRRYEISNWARPGRESVHNRIYWESRSYLGLGVGAFGCLHLGFADVASATRRAELARDAPNAIRWGNERRPAGYLEAVEAGRLPEAERESLGPGEILAERIMLALRTRDGLPLEELPPTCQAEVAALVRARLATKLGGRLVLTRRGLELHSAVAERLIPSWR